MRDYIAQIAGIFTQKVLLLMGRHATSAPGLVASRISPNIYNFLTSKYIHDPIYITGTNGKSTTTGIFVHILKSASIAVKHNTAGANLLTGLITQLLDDTKETNHDQICFEVDEAVLRHVTPIKAAQMILVHNFFRDQLDRFGELHHTVQLIQKALSASPQSPLLRNNDDPYTAHLKADVVYTYGIDDNAMKDTPMTEGISELVTCPQCDHELTYSKTWLGQLGQYHCEKCQYQKSLADIAITELKLELDSSTFTVRFPDNSLETYTLSLAGLFNVYNALGAIALAYYYGISPQNMHAALKDYKSLFGRSQSVQYQGYDIRLFLIKNPVGANEVLKLISQDENAHILIGINDNYADGRDISWLWDVDFELLSGHQTIYTTGTRGSDMAVRLKYAGIKNPVYISDNAIHSIPQD